MAGFFKKRVEFLPVDRMIKGVSTCLTVEFQQNHVLVKSLVPHNFNKLEFLVVVSEKAEQVVSIYFLFR